MSKMLKNKFRYEDYRFTTLANEEAVVVISDEVDEKVSKAAIEKLKPLLPKNIDLSKNPDLVANVFNAFVVNRANKNGDGIKTDEALAMLDNMRYKFCDIEHDRTKIVGCIIDYGFSEFGTDRPLSSDDVKGMTKPFNVTLSAVVWRAIDPVFAEKLEEASDPDSSTYNSISTSWEVGFKSYAIAVGSKNYDDAKIYAGEDAKPFEKFLRANGGKNVDEDGQPVSRILMGSVLPMGIGYVTNPAADVKGVLTANASEETILGVSKEEFERVVLEIIEKRNNISKKDENLANHSSQNEKTTVKEDMLKINKIEDITDEALKEVKANVITDFIASEIRKASDSWTAEKTRKENEAKEKDEAIVRANTTAEEAKNKLTALETEFAQFKTELATLKSEKEALATENTTLKNQAAQKEAEEAFQTRMAGINEAYNLSDEEKTLVASKIKGLDEAGFDSFYKEFEVFAKDKKKAPADDKNKKDDKKKDDDAAAAALASATADTTDLPPNASAGAGATTLLEKYRNAFSGENISIAFNKLGK